MLSRTVENGTLTVCDERGETIMTISETIDAGTFTMVVTGEIRTTVAHEFEDELTTALTVCDNIVVDFKGLNFVCAKGLQTLLQAQQHTDVKKNASLTIMNVSSEIMKSFDEIGFSDLLMIENF